MGRIFLVKELLLVNNRRSTDRNHPKIHYIPRKKGGEEP
jgi:hypothetical protein